MKDTHFLYGIATFALLAILAAFIAYATGTLPTHTPQQHVPVETVVPAATPTTVVTEKSCGCCAKRRARFRKLLKQARERKQQENQAVTPDTP